MKQLVPIWIFCLAFTAGTPGKAQEVSSPRIYSQALLAGLDKAVIGTGKFKEPSFSRYYQPFFHTLAGETNAGFHRRVILHHKKEAVRDMREALALPVAAVARFEVETGVASTLSFTLLAFHTGGQERELTASIACGGGAGASPLWEQTATSRVLTRIQDWPERVEVTLPEGGCTSLSFTTSTQGKSKGLFAAFANPRLEAPLADGAGPGYNVLFIVVDALRSDVVGVHRTEFSSVSPAIDGLEQSGTTFPDGFANGNTTLLSMNIMLLGTHPRALSYLALKWAGTDRRPLFYGRKPPYLTRLLRRAGYITFGATHNHLYFPGYKFGVDPGFDILQDSGRDGEDHPILTRRTIEFMRANRDRRFLAQVNLIAPHQPYKPPPECLETARAAVKGHKTMIDTRYLGEVCWADKHVGLLMDALEELGLKDNTLVVLTADHGEVMDYAHDCPRNRDGHRCRHLHGLTLYNEEINVPIMFALPGVVRPGVSKTVAQHVDIVPTILELVGVDEDPRMTGRSLVASLRDGVAQEEVPVYAERWLARAVRFGGYKLIHHTKKDDICPKIAEDRCHQRTWNELYDIVADPQERRELSKKLPAKVEEIRALMEQMRADFYEKSGGEGPNP